MKKSNIVYEAKDLSFQQNFCCALLVFFFLLLFFFSHIYIFMVNDTLSNLLIYSYSIHITQYTEIPFDLIFYKQLQ